jgi:hypothetical protein
LNVGRRRISSVLAAASSQAADGADGHVVIADDLAAQSDARQSSSCHYIALGDGHLVRLTFDKLDTARRAAGVSAAGMQLIDPRILLQGQNQSLPLRHLKLSGTFDSELRHDG